MSEQVIVEVTLPAPVEEVWRALRDPAEVRRWFGWEHDGIAAEIREIFVEHAEADEERRTLAWETGDRFALTARGGQTVLRVTRPAPAGGASWDGVYDDITEGWIAFVQQLRFALARHRGQDRRTVFVGGHAATSGTATVDAVLGLPDGADAPGSAYKAALAGGEVVSGQVWHRAAHQAGVTVDQYGDGLVVVMEYDAATRPPHGGADVVVTTYGLDEAAHAAVAQRWEAWWRGQAAADQ